MRTDVAGERRIHVIQGEFCVTDDPNVVLTTILGSCVSACMRDSTARVGGMNHFLLPGVDDRSKNREAESYGVHLMELLVNDLLHYGARRDRLEAKLFGGAATMQGLTDVGALNGQFAERFLRYEGIAYAGGSLGGDRGRRIQFWPTSGRARQVALIRHEETLPKSINIASAATAGELELF